ncbi:hypothetical protein IBL26_11005 [Roseomonas aerophila]|uniref:Uncharacterized protein n=1 Tax=Teichococcus aerophilus TaxID=1224513 RepID=A0ABR7RLA4_9PROT|nr:hypothetical protein [Pseudoroseomonas aerophila]MBC9207366.1 hypothetical protein [Pseudoroseomonas aerophila]
MELRRSAAKFVRDRPYLWDILHPTYDWVRQRVRDARIKRLFSDRLAPTDEAGQALIAQAIASGRPAGIGKIGGLEGEAAGFFLNNRPKGEPYPPMLREQMFLNVGLFPVNDDSLDRFCAALIDAAKQLDVMGVMGYTGEPDVLLNHATQARLISLKALDPWYFDQPWSAQLAGKRVCVVTPFARTIEDQYARRAEIWPGRDILPEFQLRTVKMPLSPGLADPDEANWEERLERIKTAVDAEPYDVLLVGAGGISLLLAAHAKKTGHVGFHMGGPTQVLFGVRGRRWDVDEFFQKLMTPAWTRPSGEEAPSAAQKIERGCYW